MYEWPLNMPDFCTYEANYPHDAYHRCLLFCGTERNGTPDSAKCLFCGTHQNEPKQPPSLVVNVLN